MFVTAKAPTKINNNKAQTKMAKKRVKAILKEDSAPVAVSMFDEQALP